MTAQQLVPRRSWSANVLQLVAVTTLAMGLVTALVADDRQRGHTTVYPAWAYDVEDDRYLVGAASDVFFATVLASHPGPPLLALPGGDPSVDDGVVDISPQTLYEVRAVGDIKGILSTLGYAPNVFLVIQAGGLDEAGELVLFENDSLLEVGKTYLLVARRAPNPSNLADLPVLTSGLFCTVCTGDVTTYTLFAPRHDHYAADTPAERATLTTEYQDAYTNQVDPIPLVEE